RVPPRCGRGVHLPCRNSSRHSGPALGSACAMQAAMGWPCSLHATTLGRMSKMLQIRNVPDRLHRLAKARAAAAGLSLSDYLLGELKKTPRLPTGGGGVSRL